jgi:hypothetical protein
MIVDLETRFPFYPMCVTVDDLQDDIQNYASAAQEFKEFYDTQMKKYMAYADPKGKADQIKMTTPRKR